MGRAIYSGYFGVAPIGGSAKQKKREACFRRALYLAIILSTTSVSKLSTLEEKYLPYLVHIVYLDGRDTTHFISLSYTYLP